MSRTYSAIRSLAPVLTVLFLTGCTLSPNPFDYSGPVPNGSAPQNDFRARSNGVIPLGGHARPWPPVVSRDVEEPVLDKPMVAPEPDAEGVQQVSAEL